MRLFLESVPVKSVRMWCSTGFALQYRVVSVVFEPAGITMPTQDTPHSDKVFGSFESVQVVRMLAQLESGGPELLQSVLIAQSNANTVINPNLYQDLRWRSPPLAPISPERSASLDSCCWRRP